MELLMAAAKTEPMPPSASKQSASQRQQQQFEPIRVYDSGGGQHFLVFEGKSYQLIIVISMNIIDHHPMIHQSYVQYFHQGASQLDDGKLVANGFESP
jgi:hypothetical protein